MAVPPGFLRRQLIDEPPIPTSSFVGQTVIVTGSNVGLGLEASRMIVSLGASKLILACRNTEKGRIAAEDIQRSTGCRSEVLEVWSLDMSSNVSVIKFASRVCNELDRLDVLLANAGVATQNWSITEGHEETITTNVITTALLICLLHPKLRQTAEKHKIRTHITVTASEMYEVAKFKERLAPAGQVFERLNDKKKASMLDRYNTSKLLIMFVLQKVAEMSPLTSSNVIINCVAPGWCRSSLAREAEKYLLFRALVKMFARPTEVGSRTLVLGAAFGPESHGQYLPDGKITPTVGLMKGAKGTELRGRVWTELRQILERIQPGVTYLT